MIIVAATQNKHKIQEITNIVKRFGMEAISREEAGVPDFEVDEDGDTFEYNSEKKAAEIMKVCGKITVADDSGLEVDALDGAPGVYSARFAGEGATDEENNAKLLKMLQNVPDEKRTARFVSVVTLVYPDGDKIAARGECPGRIIHQPKGEGGFGYDPLFVPDGFEKTYAELTAQEKNQISHRAVALKILAEKMEERISK